jgi:hypothetical protein
MKAKVILNLVLVLAVTAIALYAILQSKQKPDPGTRISQLQRDAVSRIAIERKGAAPVRLERAGGGWRIVAPFTARADTGQVDRMLDVTAATARQKLPREGLARFALEPPALRVVLNDESIDFGQVNELTNEQYVATADAVYLVAPFYGYGIPPDAGKLASRKLLADDETPVAFDLGTRRVVRDDKGQWSMAGSWPAQPGSTPTQDEFNRWADEWRATYALAAEPATGGAGKGQRITVRFKDGRSVVMRADTSASGMSLVREDEKMRYQFGADAGRRLLDPRLSAAK